MKLIINIKDPDGISQSIEDFAEKQMSSINEVVPFLKPSEELREQIVSNITDSISKFLQWGECMRIEFDLEKGTAIVLENK